MKDIMFYLIKHNRRAEIELGNSINSIQVQSQQEGLSQVVWESNLRRATLESKNKLFWF